MKRFIQLSDTVWTLLDFEDRYLLGNLKMHVQKGRSTAYMRMSYQFANKQLKTLLHRWLLMPGDQEHVDHINGDGLDNRRCNLRICTHRENARNRKPRGKSKYLGVSQSQSLNKWVATIHPENRTGIRLGTFDTELDAAIAYNKAAKDYYGEFANLNQIPVGYIQGRKCLYHEQTPRGEKHGNAKLRECDVNEIKRLLRRGNSNTNIAKRYSVSRCAIGDIAAGRTWLSVS